MTMFCIQCGQPNDDTAEVCSNCGASLVESTGTATSDHLRIIVSPEHWNATGGWKDERNVEGGGVGVRRAVPERKSSKTDIETASESKDESDPEATLKVAMPKLEPVELKPVAQPATQTFKPSTSAPTHSATFVQPRRADMQTAKVRTAELRPAEAKSVTVKPIATETAESATVPKDTAEDATTTNTATPEASTVQPETSVSTAPPVMTIGESLKQAAEPAVSSTASTDITSARSAGLPTWLIVLIAVVVIAALIALGIWLL